MDFVGEISALTGFSQNIIIQWLDLPACKYYDWKKRYGRENRHNGLMPRDWWLLECEKQAIVDYYKLHPFEGYRRLTYMMLDNDIVAVSPATVYRVLSNAGLMAKRNNKPSKKGTGFVQPLRPHEHWHVDISYLNINGTFYYMCTVLDGCSRFIVHWEIREAMKEIDVEIIIQRARERFPKATPRIITDNGPQFVAREFKEFIKISGMTHVRTSPYYPQSNGKVERVQQTVKHETVRKRAPECLQEAISMVDEYVKYYNYERLHSSIGYIAPIDVLEGRANSILNSREQKLHAARQRRKEAALKNKAA